jgi:hypothetical protein
MRRGAASCWAVLRCAAVQWRRRSGPRRRCCHRGAVIGWPSGPDAATQARLAAQRVVAGRQDVRTPATPVVALSASSVRRADVRPIGRADVRCPRDWCPRDRPPDRFHPGVRTDRPPVSAALQPPCLRRAGPWNGSVERAAPLGAAGSTCRRGPPAAWSPARIRSDGKGWCCVGRAWLARGFDGSPDHRFADAPAARRLPGPTRALVQRQGAVRLVGSTRRSKCSPAPRRRVLGRCPRGARPWAGRGRW